MSNPVRDPLLMEAAARRVLMGEEKQPKLPLPEPVEPHLTTIKELIDMKITKPGMVIDGLVTSSGRGWYRASTKAERPSYALR